MTPEELLSVLRSRGVLQLAGDEAFALTEDFERDVESIRADISSEPGYRERISTLVDDEETIDALYDGGDLDFLATFVGLGRRLPSVSNDEIARAALVLANLDSSRPVGEGVPEIFTPVGFDLLQTALEFVPRAVVYVWLEDCDSCDVVREDFDELYSTPPPGIGWFAVYGPDCSEQLQREYDVVGGPTVLFFVHGEVDTRLQGAHPRRSFEMEVQHLQDLDRPA